MGLRKCLYGQVSNSSLPAFTDNALSAILHLSSMEVLQVRPMQNGIRQGVGGGENVITVSTWFQIFCLSTILKTRLQSPCKRTKTSPPTYLSHHLPLLQYILCPQWPSFKAFLATECTFHIAVPLGISFAFTLEQNHVLSFFEPFCRMGKRDTLKVVRRTFATNAKTQRCFLIVGTGQCGVKYRCQRNPKGQPCHSPLQLRKRP